VGFECGPVFGPATFNLADYSNLKRTTDVRRTYIYRPLFCTCEDIARINVHTYLQWHLPDRDGCLDRLDNGLFSVQYMLYYRSLTYTAEHYVVLEVWPIAPLGAKLFHRSDYLQYTYAGS